MRVFQVYYNLKKGMSLGLNTFEAIPAKSPEEAKEKFFEKFPHAEIQSVIEVRR